MWSQRPRTLREDWVIPLILGGLFLSLYMPGLGSYGLFDPWETHYGEVARNMIEQENYIDPFWGSPWDVESVKRERAGFYSKPHLTMWMMSAGMTLFGANAFGVRFFFPLLAICALLSIYLAVARLVSRRAGVIASVATGLSPSFIFMSHQAVTDGPMVCLVVMGVMSLSLALFHCEEEESASRPLRVVTLGLLIFIIFGQLWVIWPMDRSPDAVRASPYTQWTLSAQWWFRELFTIAIGKGWVLALSLSPLCVWTIWRLWLEKNRRLLYFVLFYICCGLAVPAKGWLGWAPLGGALIAYLLISREWTWVLKARPGLGVLLVFLTGHIWVIAMLGGHHPQWANRFITHDHINRLISGVHSTDNGGFEYFFQWIGYGLFPLIALLPAAVMRAIQKAQRTSKSGFLSLPKVRFELFIFLWALIGFVLFSKSSTKFHHYIFPVIPAMTILISLWLDELWTGKMLHRGLLILSAVGVLFWVGQDLYRPSAGVGQGSQNWINLFTYKYDRKWPKLPSKERIDQLEKEAVSTAWREHFTLPLTLADRVKTSEPLRQAINDRRWTTTLSTPIWVSTVIALCALILMGLSTLWLNRLGVLGLLGASLWTAHFCLHTYLPMVASHWSQWELWDSYYADCERYAPEEEAEFKRHLLTTASRIPNHLEMFPRAWCKAPLVAFRMNWRGEAFYSSNTVIPVLYTKDLAPFLTQWGIADQWLPGKAFYIFTERSRVKNELEKNLPAHLKDKKIELFGQGRKFVLFKIDLDAISDKSDETR